MTFNKPNPQSLVVYLNQHQKQLHTIVVVLLSLYLIAFAAKLVWRIIPEPQLSATPTVSRAPVISSSSGQNGVNIAKIQQLNLVSLIQPVLLNILKNIKILESGLGQE